MKGLPDGCIDLVLTDPPYGMSYVSSRRKHKHEEIKDDDNLERVPEWIAELYRVQKDNTHAYIFCNDY
jgi:site-specific DNA-methyltransferase (adenine-specific)